MSYMKSLSFNTLSMFNIKNQSYLWDLVYCIFSMYVDNPRNSSLLCM